MTNIKALISRARRSSDVDDESPDNLFSVSASKGDQIMGDFLADMADALEKQQADLEEALADYSKVVGKFDDCRAALAFLYEQLTGKSPNPPNDYEGAWHEWLIQEINETLIVQIALAVYDDEPWRNKVLGVFTSDKQLKKALKGHEHFGDGDCTMYIELNTFSPSYVDDYNAGSSWGTHPELPKAEDDL